MYVSASLPFSILHKILIIKSQRQSASKRELLSASLKLLEFIFIYDLKLMSEDTTTVLCVLFS